MARLLTTKEVRYFEKRFGITYGWMDEKGNPFNHMVGCDNTYVYKTDSEGNIHRCKMK